MLSGDAARAALTKFEGPESNHVRGIRVRKSFAPKLAADIVTAVAPIAGRRESWYVAAQELDDLSHTKREKVLRALAPELGADLARWWDWSAVQPYQRGWQRRAYRSPDRVDSLSARWDELLLYLEHAAQYPQPLIWHAEWALHLAQHTSLGSLFASAIAHGDRQIAEVITASVRGEHDISGPSHNAYVALLSAPDPAGWAEMERLLVAAQRSEGLRQTILEAADLAHPDAFARILDLVVEHRLARFAGTVRALGVWLGEDLTVRQEEQVADAVAAIRDYLRQPPAAASLVDADPVRAFLGLWSLAVRDVRAATAAAEQLLESPNERTRLAASRMLTDFAIPATAAGLTRAVADSSVSVYAAAVQAWPAGGYMPEPSVVPITDAARASLHQRVKGLGKVQEVDTGLIGSVPRKVGGTLAADVLICHSGERRLDPALVAAASADGRGFAARQYAKDSAANRAALFSLLADRSATVRDTVSGALQSLPTITDDEALLVEKALTRKASDVRTTALALLQKQGGAALAASVERLVSGTADQRRAADELNGRTRQDPGSAEEVPAAVRFEVAERTPAVRPEAPPAAAWKPYHQRFRLLWTSLSAWLDEHSDVEVQNDRGVELLANLRWFHVGKDGSFPLPEVLGPWWERIQPQLADGGVEAALLANIPRANSKWVRNVTRTVVGPVASELPKVEVNALQWQVLEAVGVHARRDSWAEPLLRMLETAAAALPVDGVDGPAEVLERRGRPAERDSWGNVLGNDQRAQFDDLFGGCPRILDVSALTDEQLDRLWRALRFIDEPEGVIDRWGGPMVEVHTHGSFGESGATIQVPDQPHRWWVPTRILVEAFNRGVATRADLIDGLVVAPRVRQGFHYGWSHQDAVDELTGLRPKDWATGDDVEAAVAEVREAVIAAETARGDLPTALSETSHRFRTTYGATELISCVSALGKRPFARAYAWTQSRDSSLSHLIRANQPLSDDTADELGRLAREAKISEPRLIETAVYAPQWSRLIEQHLDWPGLESAVWWVHAHTNDDSWSVDSEIRAQWATEVSQRTPLDPTDLVRGAADVSWFHTVIDTLGEDRFARVLKAAKYASSSGGHKRAELFATALLGKADEAAVRQRIGDKRHQDSVRALGLLPLSNDKVLLDRYELLRAFVASDRTSGSQRRASESAAVEIGLENLARTAGFRDPQRLVWAMEAKAIRDLSEGPVTATHGELVVALAIEGGSPELTVHRAGKRLKSVPAKSAKIPEIAALRDREKLLRKQIRRMRTSLETACVLADAFEPAELKDLLAHPILAPMLRDLVLVDSEGFIGFPLGDGCFAAPDGRERAPVGSVRIAHPVDLLASGEWPDFQHALMSGQRRQPFKQLFRELYTLNGNERDESGTSSRRYAGQQVESRRAGGLFTSRGWVADFETGFSRTFHQQKITAWCHLVDGWGSPTEVEDATIDDVTFHPAGEWKPLPLAEVPARVFSETMRDLDLVVSVAHAGGVDPEASESSIETRGRLVDETAAMIGLSNVEVGGHHVRVKGALGTYSIHLGSGVVHRIPGNAVCIVPVSAQHRGRIFLPFADDDPRTAEVVAKAVLLARDDKIKDPTILQQLVG